MLDKQRWKYRLLLLVHLILFVSLKFHKRERKPETLLLVRLDSIGDYILFRNFIEILKDDPTFKKYKITLCGNLLWKELAENWDNSFISEFIWIDRNKFLNNIRYKYFVMKDIYSRGFDTAIEPTYSRETLFGDSIIKASNACNRISSSGEMLKTEMLKRRLITNKFYTKLINASSDNLFEFERNKEFFSILLKRQILIYNPKIDNNNLTSKELPNNYIALFIGGNENQRKWSVDKYAELINSITGYQILILGAISDFLLAQKIMNQLTNKRRIINLTGNTSLLELATIIKRSIVLISNDTCAVHIAAALQKPFICISNGKHYGRFGPYPEYIFKQGWYIYPKELVERIKNDSAETERLRYDSNWDINLIETNQVIEALSLLY